MHVLFSHSVVSDSFGTPLTLPGSPIHGILQACVCVCVKRERVCEWVCVCVCKERESVWVSMCVCVCVGNSRDFFLLSQHSHEENRLVVVTAVPGTEWQNFRATWSGISISSDSSSTFCWMQGNHSFLMQSSSIAFYFCLFFHSSIEDWLDGSRLRNLYFLIWQISLE